MIKSFPLRFTYLCGLFVSVGIATQCARQDRPSSVATGLSTAFDARPTPHAAKQRQYHKVKVTEKVIAMTFDDGPHGSNTPRLLNMLRERGLRATF